MIDLSLTLLNISWGIYSAQKESKNTAVFLSIYASSFILDELSLE